MGTRCFQTEPGEFSTKSNAKSISRRYTVNMVIKVICWVITWRKPQTTRDASAERGGSVTELLWVTSQFADTRPGQLNLHQRTTSRRLFFNILSVTFFFGGEESYEIMTFAIEQQSQYSFQWLYQTFGDDSAVCGLLCNPGFIFFIRPVFLTLYPSCWSLVLKCQGQLKFTSKTSYSRTSHSFNVVPMLDGTSCPERRSTLSPHHRAGPAPAPALALACRAMWYHKCLHNDLIPDPERTKQWYLKINRRSFKANLNLHILTDMCRLW